MQRLSKHVPTRTEILSRNGHLLVRRAVQRDDDVAQAVLDTLAGQKRSWTLSEWEGLLFEATLDDRLVKELI